MNWLDKLYQSKRCLAIDALQPYKKLPSHSKAFYKMHYYFFLRVKNNTAAAMEAAPMISGVFFNLLSEVYNLSFNIKLIFCGRSARRRMKYPYQSFPNGK